MKESDLCVIAVVYGVATWFLVMTLQLPPAAQSYPLILLTALYLCNTLFLGKQLYSFYRHRVVLVKAPHTVGLVSLPLQDEIASFRV